MLNINVMTSCCGVLPDIQRQENVRKVVKEGAVLFHLHSVMSLTSDFPIVTKYNNILYCIKNIYFVQKVY